MTTTIEQKEKVLGDKQYGNQLRCKILSDHGSNITVQIQNQKNTIGIFRFHYTDEGRKNARYPDWKVWDAYFEGLPTSDIPGYTPSVEVKNMTDLSLTVERHKQWIVENLKRGY